MTRIVVTTPTGKVGSRVTSLLVQAGVRPVVFLRDPTRLPDALRERVEVAVGVQDDVDAVLAASTGADALLWVNPPTDDTDPVKGHTRMGVVAARAVSAQAGPGHTVFVSSVGAEKRSGVGDIDGLARTEVLLDEAAEAAGHSVLHLRCGYFFSNLLLSLDDLQAGTLRTTWHLDAPMPWVDPRDIGDVAAARLLARNWTGRAVAAVHGPADLTFAEVAGIVASTTGRLIRMEQITDDDARAALFGAGLTAEQVEAVVGMAVGLRDGFTPEQPRDASTTTPTPLPAWVQTNISPHLR